jgi:hypothetical protein
VISAPYDDADDPAVEADYVVEEAAWVLAVDGQRDRGDEDEDHWGEVVMGEDVPSDSIRVCADGRVSVGSRTWIRSTSGDPVDARGASRGRA